MRVNRESAVIWIGLVLVGLGFIKTQPPLAEWGQNEWIDLVILLATWGLGKLQSSPLPGKNDPPEGR